MSKYSVVTRPGRLRWVLHLLVVTLLVCSVVSLQPDSILFQPVLQLGLALILIASYIYFTLKHTTHSQQRLVFDSSGEFTFLCAGDQSSWQISHRSNLSSLCLWIELTAVYPVQNSRRFCLFRDELTQQDFRRLSRVILRCQKHLTSGSTTKMNRL